MRQHPVFHVDHLSPWHANEVHGYTPPPPQPIEIDNDLEYEVEGILNSQKYHNQHQYLVKWKGYDTGHNSWEPATNLTHCTDILDTFHSEHPAAPWRLPMSIFATLPWQTRVTFTTTPTCPDWSLGVHQANTDVGLKEGVM